MVTLRILDEEYDGIVENISLGNAFSMIDDYCIESEIDEPKVADIVRDANRIVIRCNNVTFKVEDYMQKGELNNEARVKETGEIVSESRIKNRLIKLIKMSSEVGGFALHKWEADEMLAWLEKQGRKNDSDVKDYNSIDPHFAKPIDKVEPKFKVGDWVVSPNGVYWHIDAIQNGRYEVTTDTGQCGNWPLDTNIYRLWTIADAKPGDVLCDCHEAYDNPLIFILKKFEHINFGLVRPSDYSSYCFLTAGDEQKFKEGTYHHKHNIKPATKEQCELLFQRMKEAGYKWDAEKKELKKIIAPKFNVHDCVVKKHNSNINDSGYFIITDIDDGKYWYNNRIICDISEQDEWELYEPIRQNHDKWNEEDENIFNRIIQKLDESDNVSHYDYADFEIWLIDLKERFGKIKQNHWKPSDEQMKSLLFVRQNIPYCWEKEVLSELYEQLKKLKRIKL